MRFFRRQEKRAIESVPWDVGARPSASLTESQALALTPVFAANRHIADTLSTLPLDSYRSLGPIRQPMDTAPVLFRDLQTSGQLGPWIYQAATSLGLRGNAVGLILTRDGFGFPTSVMWVPMHEITVDDSNLAAPKWYWRGRRLAPDEFVHIPWFKVAGRTLGLSPLGAAALTVGFQAQEYGAGWFENGGFPPGTFKNSAKTVSNDEADIIKARLVNSIRRRQPLVYGADWDYAAITVPPEEAQFVETMKLTANQIASIYGIAPEECGGEPPGSLTYSNEEARQRNRMANLRPWMVRLESAFASWLPEKQYVKFNADAVIRADLNTRWAVHKIRREIGAANIDEIRALEDEPPLPNGQGQDYTPLATKAAATPTARSNGHKPESVPLKELANVEP